MSQDRLRCTPVRRRTLPRLRSQCTSGFCDAVRLPEPIAERECVPLAREPAAVFSRTAQTARFARLSVQCARRTHAHHMRRRWCAWRRVHPARPLGAGVADALRCAAAHPTAHCRCAQSIISSAHSMLFLLLQNCPRTVHKMLNGACAVHQSAIDSTRPVHFADTLLHSESVHMLDHALALLVGAPTAHAQLKSRALRRAWRARSVPNGWRRGARSIVYFITIDIHIIYRMIYTMEHQYSYSQHCTKGAARESTFLHPLFTRHCCRCLQCCVIFAAPSPTLIPRCCSP